MYVESAPPVALAGIVECCWRDHRSAGDAQRVLPDGCMDLIRWDDGVVVAGPDTGAFVASIRGPVHGIRFRPGALPAVLGVPAEALANQRVALSEVWPGDPRAVLDAAAWSTPDPALDRVVGALRDGAGVAATADALGWTERTLHRRCRAAYGYGPSTLRRILRFRRAMDLARAGTAFADVAATTGYADQAHLSREVRELAGVPLGQLVGSGANRSTATPSGSSTVA